MKARPQWHFLSGKIAMEEDRIFPLESHWQLLEKVKFRPWRS